MIPTVEYVERKFEEYNALMFGARLPKIPIVMVDAKSFLGRCVSQVEVLPDGRRRGYDFRIEINTRVDYPENVVEDTIIHEMIHYFIGYNGLEDASAHGPIFQAIMKSINDTFGRKLDLRYEGTVEERIQSASKKPSWHIVAAIYFKTGDTYVKVLPRVSNKVVDFNRIVSGDKSVDRVDYFLHNNPFFNRFPTSASLRLMPVDRAILEKELQGGRPLTIRGNQVIQ